MTKKYTAEDFAEACFAIDPSESDPHYRYLIREAGSSLPWGSRMADFNDKDMEAMGCIPVREADLTRNPYSPEALRAAWEAGEKPKEGERATKGMVTIAVDDGKASSMYINEQGDLLALKERIVYRPEPEPEPEPAPSLRELLGDLAGTIIDGDTLDEWAEALEAKGMKVVTGDE